MCTHMWIFSFFVQFYAPNTLQQNELKADIQELLKVKPYLTLMQPTL